MGKDIAKKFEGKWIQDKAENMDAVSLKRILTVLYFYITFSQSQFLTFNHNLINFHFEQRFCLELLVNF